MANVTDIIFLQDVVALHELRTQIGTVDKLLAIMAELVMVSQFGDAARQMSWADCVVANATALTAQAEQRTTAAEHGGIGA
jgi:hypothetical protein